jgi:tape measure domain-containing protein
VADVAKTVSIVFKGEDQTSAALAGVEKGLQGIGAAGDGVRKVGDEVDRLGGLATLAGGVLAGAFAAFSISELYQAFIAANVEVERFTRAATQITGGSAAAAKELEYLRSTSDRLGLSVRDTSNSYVSLLAATKGTALEGDQARAIFEAVSGAMANLGRSSADTQGALLAVQQIVSKGTVSAEELRGQLGERLPGAFGIAARSIGVTTEELGKLLEAGKLTAVDFLPKFAAELQKTFGSAAPVDGYTAAMNRLKNQFDLTLNTIGNSGAFSTTGIEFATKAVISLGGAYELLNAQFVAVRDLLRGGSFEVFNAQLELASKRANDASDKIAGPDGLNQSLAETERLTRQATAASAAYSDQSAAETERLTRQANAQTQALKDVADAFKTLGVNPDKIKKDISEVLAAFDTLTTSESVKGTQVLAGLEATLKRITESSDLAALRDGLTTAFQAGRLSADEFATGLRNLDDKQAQLTTGARTAADAIRKQADEAQRAKEKAEQWRIEMEKIASNERIKLIEARVTTNVAQVEADTKRIQSAFDSINQTINSTGDLINSAFGILASGKWLDSRVEGKLMAQIDIENANRERALRMQADLTQAQIEVLRAQAQNLQRGDALIKVDGSGLKPHLEAFMWEILKAIQTRVNQDGLKLLLGV